MKLIRVFAFISTLIFCGVAANSTRAEDQADEPPNFKSDVLPVFEVKCIRCHGAKRRGGMLDMRSLESLLEGGVTGPAIKQGNSQKSLLIELIHFNEMPPKKETPRITKEELQLLRKWIDAMIAESKSDSP